MNIGIFTNSYHPIVSGVVNTIDSMRKGLTALGHRVFIVAPYHSGYTDRGKFVLRYPSIQILSNIDFPLPIPYAPHVTAVIRKLPLDIVHAQHPFLLGTLGARLATRKKIPLVFTFHTQYEDYVHYAPFGIPEKTAKRYVRKEVSSFLKKCDAVVAPSPTIRKTVEEYGENKCCVTVPNAIDLGPFEKANGEKIREQYSLNGKKVAVFLGRLAKEKNLTFLLQAFSQASAALPDARLLLVGDGVHRPILEEDVARLKLKSKVIFTGMIPYEQVPDYLAAANIFVTASTTEVKPLSILESMATGVPVLAVRAPGAADTITDQADGWLTEEKEHIFSNALLTLLKDDGKLRKLSVGARKKAQEFGFVEMSKKLEALYKRLLLASEIPRL